MRIETKLEQWQKAGLIDETTRKNVLHYERENSRPQGIFYLTGFGAIAIALGILALVASNWQGIPAALKILTLFVLCILVSVMILREKSKNAPSNWILGTAALDAAGVGSRIGLDR